MKRFCIVSVSRVQTRVVVLCLIIQVRRENDRKTSGRQPSGRRNGRKRTVKTAVTDRPSLPRSSTPPLDVMEHKQKRSRKINHRFTGKKTERAYRRSARETQRKVIASNVVGNARLVLTFSLGFAHVSRTHVPADMPCLWGFYLFKL